jgi:IS30 family transposase
MRGVLGGEHQPCGPQASVKRCQKIRSVLRWCLTSDHLNVCNHCLFVSHRPQGGVARFRRLNQGCRDRVNSGCLETIYRSLFVQTRGVLKKELLSHLRSKRSVRRSRPVDPNGDRRGRIKDIVSIRQRPAAVEDRAVPGHWEGDLLSGPNNSYIATLVERHTRYVMLAKVAGKDTQTVVSALIKQAKKLPKELYKSLTWDRGKELTDHRRFTLATNIDVYFCDPVPVVN